MSDLKLCKDCRWCEPTVGSRGQVCFSIAKCANPLASDVCRVSGQLLVADFPYCRDHRAEDGRSHPRACGREGRWFEPKDVARIDPGAAKPWWRFW